LVIFAQYQSYSSRRKLPKATIKINNQAWPVRQATLDM
jgi:hypothetical protein